MPMLQEEGMNGNGKFFPAGLWDKAPTAALDVKEPRFIPAAFRETPPDKTAVAQHLPGYRAGREPDASWFRPSNHRPCAPDLEEQCIDGEVKITREQFLNDMLRRGISRETAVDLLEHSSEYECMDMDSYKRMLDTVQKMLGVKQQSSSSDTQKVSHSLANDLIGSSPGH